MHITSREDLELQKKITANYLLTENVHIILHHAERLQWKFGTLRLGFIYITAGFFMNFCEKPWFFRRLPHNVRYFHYTNR